MLETAISSAVAWAWVRVSVTNPLADWLLNITSRLNLAKASPSGIGAMDSPGPGLVTPAVPNSTATRLPPVSASKSSLAQKA